ncbi:hypothetical protein SYK_24720 [Pseudodesulfovibrio nedwellii]|uniref:DUF5610 domain-containing protein n=2 Tax=Pseudodesulfovibrio nedwellii TaxID=2973072 RepID=A0ABM8B387_9BACT|nr:hypothetical protein SYK_24720 [Pseudodesulfovibrio nedwellii]
MQIQAAHMNYSFMEKLKARQSQGENLGAAGALLENQPGMRLGQMADINPAKDGLTPARKALANAPGQADKLPESFSETLGEVFANEIVRRMDDTAGEDGQPKDPSDLRDSLASTMDWIRERFGDETAAAASGMIFQSTSSGVTEDTLGEGLLNTLKFIDRNFGFAAGDAAIANFNSGINSSINGFFDNGKQELFFAVDSPPQDGPSATQDLTARVVVQALQAGIVDDDAEDPLTGVLDDLKEELNKIAELQDLTSKLEAKFNPTAANTEAAHAAYQAQPGFSEPQFTSLTV